jgi:hypothetical protein
VSADGLAQRVHHVGTRGRRYRRRVAWNGNSRANSVLNLMKELWAFMRERKKLWLAPIIILFVLISGLLVLAQGTALAPFIYSIF